MTQADSTRKRARRSGRAGVAGLAVAVLTVAVWIVVTSVTACTESPIEICDPTSWVGGAQTPGFQSFCCEPDLFDAGVVTDPNCDNYAGPDAGSDAAGAASAMDAGDAMADGPIPPPCPGACVDYPSAGWDGPFLVWIGPEPQAPPCPGTAPTVVYEGHADLDAGPLPCGPCQCGAPTGACGLPPKLSATSVACEGNAAGTPVTPFDPPPAWDGGCTAEDAVDAGELCEGGPCVASITIAPLAVEESACAAIEPPIPDDPPGGPPSRAPARDRPSGRATTSSSVRRPPRRGS